MDQHSYVPAGKTSVLSLDYKPAQLPERPSLPAAINPPARLMNISKRIALVAHDNKQGELIDWAVDNKAALAKHCLYGTGATSKLLANHLEQPVNGFQCGPLGGDQQLGARIAEGALDILIFFWDPMEAQPHEPDIKALQRLAVVWNIAIANNRATADFLLTSPWFHSPYEVILPDYSEYLLRNVNRGL